jgi:hypothetical protein
VARAVAGIGQHVREKSDLWPFPSGALRTKIDSFAPDAEGTRSQWVFVSEIFRGLSS